MLASSKYITVKLKIPRQILRHFSSRSVSNIKRERTYMPVSDFYTGKSVFVTGGTGFVGKVFIEKLLYSCKEIDKVYVLVRAQNVQAANERIRQLVNKPLFTRLKNERPNDLNKIVPVVGDIAVPKLGLSAEDEDKLLEKVSVVFHSAATIQFNEPLKVAFNINLEGTKRLINLCQRMKNMKAFVHISTAYSNTDKAVIEEVVYPPPAKLEDVYKFIEEHGDDKTKTLKYIDGRPNTYTFTKALAETLVAENHHLVPSVIVRPSMVKASFKEPLEGWVDAWSIPTTILFTVGKGVNRVVVGDKNTIVDFIPVDYVTNLSIVAAARCNRSDEVAVYNCCTSVCNPITLHESLSICSKESSQSGSNELPLPGALIARSRLLINIVVLITQTVPAYIADLWLRIKGKKPRYVEFNRRINTLREKSQFFTGTTWFITSRRAQELAASLSPRDQKEFPCNPADVHWKKFMPIHLSGVRKYLAGEQNGKQGKIKQEHRN